ncbi:hypothetical protein QWT69_14420 [Sporosarcina oncorhynchi]|uniref:YHYH domain-containing protein n=1 Tax=Sporosarcina oncorhynchi TaxID=3056444 RepID=A0ABZ0L372_9BACL|nr:hypothetical protein [Sporosarcina sp. T2O-4]WOV87052.1 hypothetical protein QWT69_14420 [Sporosarcina sp. T2O-4]
MKMRKFLTVLILGATLFSFSDFAHAEGHDDNTIHNHDEATHNHGELTETGDIGLMYVPCPVADPNPHNMIFMSSHEIYKGQTGSYHYHMNRYCVAELYLVRSLYSCKYCGWDEWRESNRIFHPGQ